MQLRSAASPFCSWESGGTRSVRPGAPIMTLKVRREAGFNTMWPLGRARRTSGALEHGRDARAAGGLDAPRSRRTRSSQIRDHPNLLGNVWADEPTGRLLGPGHGGRIPGVSGLQGPGQPRSLPTCAVFVNDVPWIDPARDRVVDERGTRPVTCRATTTTRSSTRRNAQPPVRSRTRSAWRCRRTTSRKPVWLIVGAIA